MRIYDGFDILRATVANFYCILVKQFGKFMMKWKLTIYSTSLIK